jgi:ABC-type spermidine/putrescine transport system permease subunit I
MYPRWLWPSFALPGVLWLIVLFIIPFYAVIGVAFGSIDPILLSAVPIWNPVEWNVGWMGEVLSRLEPGGDFWTVFLRTCEYVFVSLGLSLLIGYPVAYYISRHATRMKNVLLILLILPFWISYLMRMFAWVNLLSPDGYVNRFLQYTHVIDQPYGFLDGKASTVIMALVYGYIPYLILPLYASLDRIDKSQLEAARDLGASPFRAFLHVTLPLSKTGILGGSVLIALPMFGDYYTPNLVSGAPTTSMLGNQIDLYFHSTSQPTIGAALTILMSIFLVILMAYYLVTVARATKDLESV